MLVVVVSGYFDSLHEGHKEYFRLARKLGDYLLCVISQDKHCIMKKGRCNEPLKYRAKAIKRTKLVDKIVPSIDDGCSIPLTLKFINPDIFAKGGDRFPENMPLDEVEMCEEIECEIVYGLGLKIASSSERGEGFA